jgi:hypothetical protein
MRFVRVLFTHVILIERVSPRRWLGRSQQGGLDMLGERSYQAFIRRLYDCASHRGGYDV